MGGSVIIGEVLWFCCRFGCWIEWSDCSMLGVGGVVMGCGGEMVEVIILVLFFNDMEMWKWEGCVFGGGRIELVENVGGYDDEKDLRL